MLIIIMKYFLIKPKKLIKSKAGKIQVREPWIFSTWSKNSQGNTVMYHNYDISKSKQMSLRSIGYSVASLIWEQLNKSGSKIKRHYF